jgi:hypothetical protein
VLISSAVLGVTVEATAVVSTASNVEHVVVRGWEADPMTIVGELLPSTLRVVFLKTASVASIFGDSECETTCVINKEERFSFTLADVIAWYLDPLLRIDTVSTLPRNDSLAYCTRVTVVFDSDSSSVGLANDLVSGTTKACVDVADTFVERL